MSLHRGMQKIASTVAYMWLMWFQVNLENMKSAEVSLVKTTPYDTANGLQYARKFPRYVNFADFVVTTDTAKI